MYLPKVAALIERKDIRSARTWCKKYGVEIHKDSTGEFIFQNDFDMAYDLPLILVLKNKHGDNWEDVYNAYKNDELHKLIEHKKQNVISSKSHKPKSEQSKDFLSKISNKKNNKN